MGNGCRLVLNTGKEVELTGMGVLDGEGQRDAWREGEDGWCTDAMMVDGWREGEDVANLDVGSQEEKNPLFWY